MSELDSDPESELDANNELDVESDIDEPNRRVEEKSKRIVHDHFIQCLNNLDECTEETKNNIETIKDNGNRNLDFYGINQSARLFVTDPVEWAAYALHLREYLELLTEEELKNISPADNTVYYGFTEHNYSWPTKNYFSIIQNCASVPSYIKNNHYGADIDFSKGKISFLEIYDAGQLLYIIGDADPALIGVCRLKLEPGTFKISGNRYSKAVSIIIEKSKYIEDLEMWSNPILCDKLISLDMRNIIFIKNPSNALLEKALKLYPKLMSWMFRYHRRGTIYSRLKELKDNMV